MSTASLALMLVIPCGLLAIVLNHAYARLALVELTLNEGLPPGHERAVVGTIPASTREPRDLLDPGVHVFLSRSCHACQRLIEELDDRPLGLDTTLHLHYVDRPRPVAASAAARQGAALFDHQVELTAQVAADPLPYTIAVGSHDLISRAVTPTVAQVIAAAHDAGFIRESP